MKAPLTILVLAALAVWDTPSVQAATQAGGVAVAVVFDTSGSMAASVRDSAGGRAPKYIVGRRALGLVVQRLQAFVADAPAGSTRKLEAGLYGFSSRGTRKLVSFGPFDAKRAGQWIRAVPVPSGGTPLGNAILASGRVVLHSKLPRKHILVITDGANTVGPRPEVVLPRLEREAGRQQTKVYCHFVAFDVEAKVFSPLKKLGVTVVSAANEAELKAQLGFVLEQKILLEDPESVGGSPTTN